MELKATSAALMAQSHDLQLVVRHVLAGLGHGIHVGRERGAGIEFAEYRAYAPGDEWRRVDWKLLARADRYYVREAERDSHVAVWLWLDATASMAEPSRSQPGLDKLRQARILLACIAAIAQRQGDAFGLVICHGGQVRFTPASRGPRQLHRVIAQLERTEPGGSLPDAAVLQKSLHFARAPSLIFAVSDFLEWPSPLSQALLRMRHMRHDVRALCLQTQAEVEASFSADASYCDAEPAPGREQAVLRFPAQHRTIYRANHAAHFDAFTADCRRNDIAMLRACIEQSPESVLRSWLRLAGRT